MRTCGCGCGAVPPIAKRTNSARDQVAGQPVRYILGHQTRKVIAPSCGYVVDEATGCWLWMLRVNENGYGRIKVKGRCTYAHIFQYEHRHGPVPTGLELDHLCRNRRCCNPDHLEAVTRTENVRRGTGAKLTVSDVRAIRASTAHPKELAKRHNISVPVIYGIRAGTIWDGV